ncbi:MAG: transcriptional activator NhaR [Gemmatimonadaceae bacterium]|nr:transcriptional activator NhaR [Gemmatimonadaceae bacterium]
MEWLNYHHLLYFWVVAREGSVAKASVELGLAQPTVSGQIHALERAVGRKLFARSGRNLILTETGQVAYRYAEEIFTIGRELQRTLTSDDGGSAVRFQVGFVDVLPKLVAYRLMQPVMRASPETRVTFRDGRPERLIADLSIHALDLVISDQPVSPTIKVRAYNHLLGETPVTVFAPLKLAARAQKGFPESLNGMPFLLPTESTTLRRELDEYFAQRNIRPDLIAEFEDSALLKTFGEAGEGCFVAPSIIEDEIRDRMEVKIVGRLDDVRERYYAVSLDRKVKHPLVNTVLEHARSVVFAKR